jgi:hypothetical protein
MTQAQQIAARLAERVGPSVVEEVRAIRQQLDEDSGHDIHALADNARRVADEFRKSRSIVQKRSSEK